MTNPTEKGLHNQFRLGGVAFIVHPNIYRLIRRTPTFSIIIISLLETNKYTSEWIFHNINPNLSEIFLGTSIFTILSAVLITNLPKGKEKDYAEALLVRELLRLLPIIRLSRDLESRRSAAKKIKKCIYFFNTIGKRWRSEVADSNNLKVFIDSVNKHLKEMASNLWLGSNEARFHAEQHIVKFIHSILVRDFLVISQEIPAIDLYYREGIKIERPGKLVQSIKFIQEYRWVLGTVLLIIVLFAYNYIPEEFWFKIQNLSELGQLLFLK